LLENGRRERYPDALERLTRQSTYAGQYVVRIVLSPNHVVVAAVVVVVVVVAIS